jgi:hypothetical protein
LWSTGVLYTQDGTSGNPGTNTALIYAYKRSATAPSDNPGTVDYSFSTNAITTASLANTWSKTITAGTDPLYVTVATAASTTAADNVLAAEWTTPVLLVKNGTDGTPGINTATVFLYARNNNSTTAPTLDTAGTATYTFTTGAISGTLPTGWTTLIPAESNGTVIWVVQATAAASTTTDTIANTEWSTARVLALQGTNGSPGTRGSRSLYSSSSSYTSTYTVDANEAGAVSYAVAATTLIAAAVSGSTPTTPIKGDTVTFSNPTAESEYVYTITHDGTNWVTPGTVLDGKLLVTGTVTAAKINSNGLSIKDTAGNIILSAGASLADSSLAIPGTVTSVPAGWQNSNVSVGGKNLLIGSASGLGWTYSSQSGTQFISVAASTVENSYIYSPYFSMWGNQEITLSFDSKEDAIINSRDLYILPDNYPSLSLLYATFTKSTNWVRYYFTFTTPATWGTITSPTAVRLRIDHNGSTTGASALIYARNIKIELGNKPTDWSPAPEDSVYTDLSNAPSTIKNSSVSISSAGTLSGAGGGTVSITGLGYSGDLNATYGANWAANVVGASGVNTSITNAAETATWAKVTGAGRPASYATVGKSYGLPFESWYIGGHSIVTISDGKVGSTALQLIGGGGYPNQGNYIPIDASKTYRTRFWARPSSNCTGLLYFSLRQFLDAADASTGPVNGGRSPYKPSAQSRSSHNTTYGTGAWGEYSFTWTSADWQTGVKYVLPEFLDNYSGGAGNWQIQDFTFEEVTEVTAAATAAADRLSKSTASVLSATVSVNAVTGAGFVAGNLQWNSTGARTGGKGVAMTPGGILGHDGTKTTFAINASTGAATFAGSLDAASGSFTGDILIGTTPAISGTTMTGTGAKIVGSTGNFALGNSTTNITFNGTKMSMNGYLIDIDNLIPGAALPNYVRTYTGGTSDTITVGNLDSNMSWMPLRMDASSLNNRVGATDYDTYRTLFPAGTYFYELSVPVKNNTSDTNDATYTALVVNPPGGPGTSQQYGIVGYNSGYDNESGVYYNSPIYDYYNVPNSYTVISKCGVNVVGDWQTATIFGVGKFTITAATYITPVVMSTEYNGMNVVARSGYGTLIWRVWSAN